MEGSCSTAAVHINVPKKSAEDFSLTRAQTEEGIPINLDSLLLSRGNSVQFDRVCHERPNRTPPQRSPEAPQSTPHRRPPRSRTRQDDGSRPSTHDPTSPP